MGGDGTGWCWGVNDRGQIGNGTSLGRDVPQRVDGSDWNALRSDSGTTCGLRDDGTAWCWGWNGYGQVGDGTLNDRLTPYRLS